MRYKHTQIGYLMIWVTIAITIYFGILFLLTPLNLPAILIMFLVILIILSFSTLKVTIDKEYVRIKFGYGIFWKKFALKDISSVKSVRNHWYYGWGIRIWFWPRMIIFNNSGFYAVEIIMKNGKRYRIGTDEPSKLERAIKT